MHLLLLFSFAAFDINLNSINGSQCTCFQVGFKKFLKTIFTFVGRLVFCRLFLAVAKPTAQGMESVVPVGTILILLSF